MAKDNPFNKYSPCGGLNGIWVARELENRDEENYYSYSSTTIVPNVVNSTLIKEDDNTNIINTSSGYDQEIAYLKIALQTKFDFLKKYSDGSETDYEIAKFVISNTIIPE